MKEKILIAVTVYLALVGEAAAAIYVPQSRPNCSPQQPPERCETQGSVGDKMGNLNTEITQLYDLRSDHRAYSNRIATKVLPAFKEATEAFDRLLVTIEHRAVRAIAKLEAFKRRRSSPRVVARYQIMIDRFKARLGTVRTQRRKLQETRHAFAIAAYRLVSGGSR